MGGTSSKTSPLQIMQLVRYFKVCAALALVLPGLVGCGKNSSGSAASTNTYREPAVKFVTNLLQSENYTVVQLLPLSRAPQGFPQSTEIDYRYFEAMGAYAGRSPQTLWIAVEPSGSDSWRVVKRQIP